MFVLLLFTGLERLCLDVEYALEKKCGIFLRLCWGLLIPIILFTVFIYSMVTEENLEFRRGYVYPNSAYSEYFYITVFLCSFD